MDLIIVFHVHRGIEPQLAGPPPKNALDMHAHSNNSSIAVSGYKFVRWVLIIVILLQGPPHASKESEALVMKSVSPFAETPIVVSTCMLGERAMDYLQVL